MSRPDTLAPHGGTTKAALAVVVVLLVWFAAALVRVENERYALLVGMCRAPGTGLVDHSCLRTVQTRTGWWWHLLYALRG